jgi:hypothetical protein
VAAGVPEQLAASGEPELAQRWQTAAAHRPSPAATAAEAVLRESFGGVSIPSTLRRRALETLRRSRGLRELVEVQGVPELRDGLRAAGADALVYLVPGQDTEDGTAVLVRPVGEPVALTLPGLGVPGREPLERYLDAAARRSATPEHDREAWALVRGPWQEALEGLCDWAGPAVVGPVLDALGGGRGREAREAPVRLVLVPCGNLGAVPWHAALLPEDRGHVRACEAAVITYAASGGEFLRAARRERIPVRDRAVLVSAPRDDMDWAQDEVTALIAAYYPGAVIQGVHDEAPVAAAGTPEDVLAELPGASVLHLVVHGKAGLSPTESALELAEPEHEPEPGPGQGRDPGRLTVRRVLDVPAGETSASAGPLVVLSACETDLSTRDHDEALTPITAFLARGATDAVGSRWKVPDSASAALMVAFHHYLAEEALAPPDALRAAQLWMLDRHRRPLPGLSGDLLTRTVREAEGLAALPAWAGFIHQGNPAPAPRPPEKDLVTR